MTILHIDSSILGDHSVSRKVSAGIVARVRALLSDSASMRASQTGDS